MIIICYLNFSEWVDFAQQASILMNNDMYIHDQTSNMKEKSIFAMWSSKGKIEKFDKCNGPKKHVYLVP